MAQEKHFYHPKSHPFVELLYHGFSRIATKASQGKVTQFLDFFVLSEYHLVR